MARPEMWRIPYGEAPQDFRQGFKRRSFYRQGLIFRQGLSTENGQLFGWQVQVVLWRVRHMVHPKGHGQDKQIEVLRACQGYWFLLISCCPDIPDQFLLIY